MHASPDFFRRLLVGIQNRECQVRRSYASDEVRGTRQLAKVFSSDDEIQIAILISGCVASIRSRTRLGQDH